MIKTCKTTVYHRSSLNNKQNQDHVESLEKAPDKKNHVCILIIVSLIGIHSIKYHRFQNKKSKFLKHVKLNNKSQQLLLPSYWCGTHCVIICVCHNHGKCNLTSTFRSY